MNLTKYIFLVSFIFGTSIAYANEVIEDDDIIDDSISVFGSGCEVIKPNEAKSSVRVRVTDKASFTGVSGLTQLSNVKRDFNEHDFNVLVYSLVDEALEDMSVKTTKQDDTNICVEVTGFIRPETLLAAIQKSEDERNATKESSNKPEEKIEDVVAVVPKEAPAIEKDIPQKVEHENNVMDKKSFVFIPPTHFFNNTQSEKHAEVIREQFSGNDYFYITDKKELADYIVRTKVLRAKVDPVNSNTNRMQMVIAVELQVMENGNTSTEHQNRFVLFSSEEDEQEVANKLMTKLFEKASEQTINQIEQAERRKNRGPAIPKIITPANSSSSQPNDL